MTAQSDITQRNYKKLTLQTALDSLSYSIHDLLTGTVIAYNKTKFPPNGIIEEQLWKAFSEFPMLREKYDNITVIHDNPLNTFVPHSLFDEHYLGSYLQYNVKVFATDFFAFDKLNNQEINNVYVPYVSINNFLLDHFSHFDYLNANTVLVDKILQRAKQNTKREVYIHFGETHFEIIATQNNGNLLYFNSFEYHFPEDFLYYTLFAFEQLQLSQEHTEVYFLGGISTESEYYKRACLYIKNCSLLNVTAEAQKFNRTENETRTHFILFQA